MKARLGAVPENVVRMETMLIDKMDKMGIEVFILRENLRLYRLLIIPQPWFFTSPILLAI